MFCTNYVHNYSLEHNLLQAYMTCGENTLYRVKIVTDLSCLINFKKLDFISSLISYSGDSYNKVDILVLKHPVKSSILRFALSSK